MKDFGEERWELLQEKDYEKRMARKEQETQSQQAVQREQKLIETKEVQEQRAQKKEQELQAWKEKRFQARNRMTQIRNQISHLEVAAKKAPSVMERGEIEDQIKILKKQKK